MRSGGTTRTDARGPAGWRAACSAARRRRGHARFVRRLAPARGGQCARALGCEPVQSACAPPWRRTAWTPRVANESQLPAALHSWMGDARAHRMKFHAARGLGRRQTQHARTVTSLLPILKKTSINPRREIKYRPSPSPAFLTAAQLTASPGAPAPVLCPRRP
jgi:hypothetical protein